MREREMRERKREREREREKENKKGGDISDSRNSLDKLDKNFPVAFLPTLRFLDS